VGVACGISGAAPARRAGRFAIARPGRQRRPAVSRIGTSRFSQRPIPGGGKPRALNNLCLRAGRFVRRWPASPIFLEPEPRNYEARQWRAAQSGKPGKLRSGSPRFPVNPPRRQAEIAVFANGEVLRRMQGRIRRARMEPNASRLTESPAPTPREDLRTRSRASPRRQRQGSCVGRGGGLQRAFPAARPTQGPLTWATLRVLRALLWRFHGADGGGRCFPAYEKIAAAAKCCRDTEW
jgi:hypothetical protein